MANKPLMVAGPIYDSPKSKRMGGLVPKIQNSKFGLYAFMG